MGGGGIRAEPIVVGPVLFSYGQLFSVSWLVARFEKIDVACNTATSGSKSNNNSNQSTQPRPKTIFSPFFSFLVVSLRTTIFAAAAPVVVATLTR